MTEREREINGIKRGIFRDCCEHKRKNFFVTEPRVENVLLSRYDS